MSLEGQHPLQEQLPAAEAHGHGNTSLKRTSVSHAVPRMVPTGVGRSPDPTPTPLKGGRGQAETRSTRGAAPLRKRSKRGVRNAGDSLGELQGDSDGMDEVSDGSMQHADSFAASSCGARAAQAGGTDELAESASAQGGRSAARGDSTVHPKRGSSKPAVDPGGPGAAQPIDHSAMREAAAMYMQGHLGSGRAATADGGRANKAGGVRVETLAQAGQAAPRKAPTKREPSKKLTTKAQTKV